MARATARAAKNEVRKPTHRLWMVQDQPNGKPPSWTEITGLWETKNGDGVSGATKFWLTIPPGTRLVAMKANERQQ
jgi:hypothetical protein